MRRESTEEEEKKIDGRHGDFIMKMIVFAIPFEIYLDSFLQNTRDTISQIAKYTHSNFQSGKTYKIQVKMRPMNFIYLHYLLCIFRLKQ